ncbi:hypothetical protein NSZ01_18990 [Nocardioides szechwanensis]|uniref:Alpha/beta hydrolase family protein n=1 Tax=Nocardioides szechwanensis TaxID=1005944 RepID=A0A1H0H0C5_9ACTN|nr:alpha/beta fold hydrolase [Nocardioides szechwanensis]GEP34131.1 hypothetical protein NSZ01_18990 [Nocardioides szechwanensis]SDO12585.1 Alpha/beta hydrolase family protein [Nocardioides szechwanensis]
MGVYFRYAEHTLPGPAGRLARDLWFAAPPRMAGLPAPEGGEPFEVEVQGHIVRGIVWSDVPDPAAPPRTVYLMHGWGGRGSQFGAMVEPLLRSGRRVVMLDAPAHGDSDHGPAGPRRTNGLEFAKALDAVFCRFGPADAVVAHSLGTIATYLALRFGWLGTKRLVFIAPMVESQTLFDQFEGALGFGKRTRRAFDRSVLEWVGIPVAEFDARFQAAQVEPVPTLVITDRGDRQTPYDDVVDFAWSVQAPLVTTEGLGHRKILRDPDVVACVVDFVSGRAATGGQVSVIRDGSSVA